MKITTYCFWIRAPNDFLQQNINLLYLCCKRRRNGHQKL